MEKVKLTQKQTDALESALNLKSKKDLLNSHAHMFYNSKDREALNDLSTFEVAEAIFEGYETIPEFKVGDWVYHVDGYVGKITEINEYETIFIDIEFAPDSFINTVAMYFRHATEEEIQREKKRRFWSKLGREVDGWKDGDVVSLLKNNRFLTYLDQGEINNNTVSFPTINKTYSLKDIRLVTPVEQRLDR